MELRTLKDLNLYQCLEDYPAMGVDADNLVVDVKGLKEEAIKWIKMFDGDFPIPDEVDIKPFTSYEEGFEPVIEWIKHFFNLGNDENDNINLEIKNEYSTPMLLRDNPPKLIKQRYFVNGQEITKENWNNLVRDLK